MQIVDIDVALSFAQEALRVLPEVVDLLRQSELQRLVNQINLGDRALLPLEQLQMLDCLLVRLELVHGKAISFALSVLVHLVIL